MIFLGTAGSPDEYQIVYDLPQGMLTAKQKDAGNTAPSIKVLLQMFRHCAPVARNKNKPLLLNPAQEFGIARADCRCSVSSHDQDLDPRFTS